MTVLLRSLVSQKKMDQKYPLYHTVVVYRTVEA